MKNHIAVFIFVFSQFATAQIFFSDKDSGDKISEHHLSFYENNTTANIYTNKNGQEMLYRLFLPANYDPQKKYPLVLAFHGAGSRGNDNLKQLRPWVAGWMDEEVQKDHPCIILMPQCPVKQQWVNVPWKDGSYPFKAVPISNPMKLSKEIFDKIVKEYAVNENQVYVMGMSMGGYGAWNFMMRYPNLIAGAIPICGAGDPMMAKKIRKIPIWAFHGDKDKTVPLSGSTDMMEALIDFNKNKARLTIYKDVGHNSYELAWKQPELIDWLFNQKRNN
ncbi:alpha/beta hydrolase-fold protein [Formosa undariae]|uniref:Alpha/beta hydrolase-fold protein n=1 Tax=Formosa undariae TaxID=1325436 RepID=A0ABV5EZV2_9FLAO